MICFFALKKLILVSAGGPDPVVSLLVAEPILEATGHAAAPCLRIAAFEVLQRVTADVSIFVPGLNSSSIFVTRLGLPPGSPGSLQVISVSIPADDPAVLGECVISKVAANCGLATAPPAVTSTRAPAKRANPFLTRQRYHRALGAKSACPIARNAAASRNLIV